MIKRYNEYIVLINESYKFAYNCVIAKNLKELEFIIDNMKEISADTFLKYVSLNNINRHLRDNIKYKTIDDLKKDWTVSFYKIKKNGIDAYIFRNSATEYIFKNTEKPKIKEKIDADNENEEWNTKKNYRVLKTYKGIKVGTILPISKRKIKTIIQHKNGKTQFEIEEYWFNADNIIKYEYNDEINEKLTDKLSGFNEESLKQQFLNGKIEYNNYLSKCNYYNFELPSKDEIHIYVSKYMNINDMFFHSCLYNFLDIIKTINLNKVSNLFLSMSLDNIIKNGNLELLKDVLKQDVDLNDEISNPLSSAVLYKQYDIVKYLLEIGAEIFEHVMYINTSSEIKDLLKKYYDKQNDK